MKKPRFWIFSLELQWGHRVVRFFECFMPLILAQGPERIKGVKSTLIS